MNVQPTEPRGSRLRRLLLKPLFPKPLPFWAWLLICVGAWVLSYATRTPNIYGYQGKPTRHWLLQLRSEDPAVRVNAAKVMGGPALFPGKAGTLYDPSAIPALVAALDDSDSSVRAAAANSLGSTGRFAAPADQKIILAALERALKAHPEECHNLLFALQSVGEEAVPIVAAALRHPSVAVRREAATMLWLMGVVGKARAAVPALTEALKDPDAQVRMEADLALRKMEVRQAKPSARVEANRIK